MWGFDGIYLTPRLYNLNISFVVFIVHLIPFLLMNFFFYREYRKLYSLNRNDLLMLLLVALSGGVIGTMAIVRALFLVNFQDLSIVVLLQKLQPVFAIVLAYFILNEKMRENFFIWASLAVLASYTLTFGLHLPDVNTGTQTAMAAGYSLIAAFAFGSATVLGKGVLKKLTFYAATFYRYGLTSIIMLLIIVITGNVMEFRVVTATNWIVIFIIALTVGSGAIFLYYYGLRKVPAMLSTILELFFPISAILFDYIFNDKILSTVQWISALIMLFAIVKLSISPQIGKKLPKT